LKGRHHPFAHVSFAFDELMDAILFHKKYDSNFQPLHPIFLHPRIDESQLPPILSPFFDQNNNTKQHIPCNLDRTNICKSLTSLLIATEGHPTRLSKLLEQLLECPLVRPIDGATYLDIVTEWLNKDKIDSILVAMDEVHQFPTDGLLNLCEELPSFSKSQAEILEDLAFEATSPNSAEFLVKGHQLHYWSMSGMWSRPILPITVWKSMPTLSEQGPRGVALLELRDACLQCYDVTNPIKDGTKPS
jgi:hypothetical protein